MGHHGEIVMRSRREAKLSLSLLSSRWRTIRAPAGRAPHDLHHVRMPFLDQADGGTHRRLHASLQGAERHVTACDGPLRSPSDRQTDEGDLVDGDLEVSLLAPHVAPNTIAHREEVYARAVHDLGHLVVVHDRG